MNEIINALETGIKSAWSGVKKGWKDTKNAVDKDFLVKKGGVWQATPKGKKLGINPDIDGFVDKNITNMQRAKSFLLNDDGRYSKARIAGAAAGGFMGVSAAGRIASGGGLYRDSEGNFDIIGIPIV